MLGMRSKDASGSAPAKKRTGVMTNSPELADTLAKFQCDSTHRHVVLEGGRPKACEEYPDEFCEVVLRAVQHGWGMKSTAQTLEVNTLSVEAISCIEAKSEEREVRQAFVLNCSEVSKMEVDRTIYENYDFVDDISMKPLDKARAIEARRLEIEFFRKMKV